MGALPPTCGNRHIRTLGVAFAQVSGDVMRADPGSHGAQTWLKHTVPYNITT